METCSYSRRVHFVHTGSCTGESCPVALRHLHSVKYNSRQSHCRIYTGCGSFHSALLKVHQSIAVLLKFIASDVNWKTELLRSIVTTKWPFKTTPVWCPPRSMRWWILSVTRHITRAGQVNGGLLSLETRSVRVCQSAERVPNTLFFKEPQEM